jgi:hypothetical protein
MTFAPKGAKRLYVAIRDAGRSGLRLRHPPLRRPRAFRIWGPVTVSPEMTLASSAARTTVTSWATRENI